HACQSRHRRHATDIKSTTPLHVRHGERISDDAREMRHVHHLAQTIIFLEAGHEFFRGIDTPRHSHAALAWNLPKALFNAVEFDFLCGHSITPANPFEMKMIIAS